IGDDKVTSHVVAARIVAAIDGGVATDRPTYARVDQRVTLYAAIETDDHRVYCDAPAIEWRGKKLAPLPLSTVRLVELAWNGDHPAATNYSNGDGPAFHFEAIEYRTTPIAAHTGSIAADVRPTLTPDYGRGVGTMRFQIVANNIASPGPEAHRGRG